MWDGAATTRSYPCPARACLAYDESLTMPDKPPSLSSAVRLGSAMAGLVVAGLLLGWFVDSRLHTLPVFVFVGLALGMTASGYLAYKKFREM